jgi:ABC-2 type transport system ATP-binding protein
MIKVENLQKDYGSLTALRLSHLEIKKGESFGLVGNNGAGKTTFFNLVLDLILPTKGIVYSKGKNVRQSDHWKAYTGAFLDERFLIGFLTPEEYFAFIGRLHGYSQQEVKEELQPFERLFNGEVLGKNKLIRELSRGNQKKAGIAGSLLCRPEVVILDEPFSNIDPSSVNRLKILLNQWQEERDVTFLISSHDLNHITEVCRRIVIIDHGEMVRDMETDRGTLLELEDYCARL